MHCFGGYRLVSVLFVAALITLFFLKTFSLLVLLINNIGKTLLLGSPPKQNGRPVGYITLLTLISPSKRGLWS